MSLEDSRSRRILIVDDEPDLCEITSFRFQRAGYETVCAGNAAEALDVVSSQDVDLIISDVRMPGGGGEYLLDELGKREGPLPGVIFMTGFTDMSLERAYQKGALGVFSKPVDFDAILNMVQRCFLPKAERWSRGAERIDASFIVRMQFRSGEDLLRAATLNIGTGGLFVAIDEAELPDIGQHVGFDISIGCVEYGPIRGAGVVRWVRRQQQNGLPRGFGLEFVSFKDDTSENFYRLLNDVSTRAFIPES